MASRGKIASNWPPRLRVRRVGGQLVARQVEGLVRPEAEGAGQQHLDVGRLEALDHRAQVGLGRRRRDVAAVERIVRAVDRDHHVGIGIDHALGRVERLRRWCGRWPKALTVLSRPRASSARSSCALRKSLAWRPKPATRLSPKAAISTVKSPPTALWISAKLPPPPKRAAPSAPTAPGLAEGHAALIAAVRGRPRCRPASVPRALVEAPLRQRVRGRPWSRYRSAIRPSMPHLLFGSRAAAGLPAHPAWRQSPLPNCPGGRGQFVVILPDRPRRAPRSPERPGCARGWRRLAAPLGADSFSALRIALAIASWPGYAGKLPGG